MKIFTVVGARPNFLKLDPNLPQTIVHTGQHHDYRLSQIFFDGLNLPAPKWNLGCTNVGQMIDKLQLLFTREKPDLVMVIGDTNSSLAGAIAAVLSHVKIAHIESGMRCGDLQMPEELNRIIIDKISNVLFCPNQTAAMNLLQEGITQGVHIVGDPLFDSMGKLMPIKKSKNYKSYSVLTVHRAANTDDKQRLSDIMEALGESEEPIIFPIHPRTRKMLRAFKIKVPTNIKLKQPLGYRDMLTLVSNARKVITDSGGIQREAYWMNVPVIILRDRTEWLEIINKWGGVLVDTNKSQIIDAVKNFNGRINSSPEPGVNARIRTILYKYV